MHQATGRDLNLVVGQKFNAAVGGDMEEQIIGMRKSVSAISQLMVAPKSHIGSESVNIFKVLCDALELIQKMATQLSTHVHGPTPPPTIAEAFAADAAEANELSILLKEVTLS